TAETVIVQPDGKIILAGYSYIDADFHDAYSIVRLNADGSLDTSFSDDGKILVAGYSEDSNSADYFSLLRLNPDGSLDTSFSGDGKAGFPLGGSGDDR